MIKIGIECENIEDPKSRWGVGQLTFSFLKAYVENPEWQKKYELYLYFKKNIPEDAIFKTHSSLFKTRVLGSPSFNIFYHILMPIRAMLDRVDWMLFSAYMLPPLYLGKSIVMLTDDVYMEYKYGSLPFRYKLAYRLFTNWAAMFATKILAISETSKKEVARLYNINPDRIFVDYLGVNLSNTKLQTPNYKQIPNSKFKIPSQYILYVGQALPRRHLRETVLAFQKISKDFPDLNLVAVGKDKYNPPVVDELINKVNLELGGNKILHYDYIEKREDIEKLYGGARALIYVSDREAFGLPPLEALALGTPPVIMDNKLGHELFDDYAFFSKGGTSDEIAEAMKKALTDFEKNEKIKISGREFVKKYNWNDFSNKLLKQFE